jgi:hypothetical protein
MNEGHTMKKCFGFMKYWSKTNNVQRLLHHLVIEEYLSEDIQRHPGKRTFSYIRLGPLSELLTTYQITIQFPISTGKLPLTNGCPADKGGTTSRAANGFSYDCFRELLEVVRDMARKSKVKEWNKVVEVNVRANKPL